MLTTEQVDQIVSTFDFTCLRQGVRDIVKWAIDPSAPKPVGSLDEDIDAAWDFLDDLWFHHEGHSSADDIQDARGRTTLLYT